MADFENNVDHLKTIRINENNLEFAEQVAADLVDEMVGTRINLSDLKHIKLVRPFAKHLLNNYQSKLKRGFPHEDSARQAMEEEKLILKQQADKIQINYRRITL